MGMITNGRFMSRSKVKHMLKTNEAIFMQGFGLIISLLTFAHLWRPFSRLRQPAYRRHPRGWPEVFALHSARSWASSSLRPLLLRSFLTTCLQVVLGRPLPRFARDRSHAMRVRWSAGRLNTCPNHLSLAVFTCSSMGITWSWCLIQSFRTRSFLVLPRHHLIIRISDEEDHQLSSAWRRQISWLKAQSTTSPHHRQLQAKGCEPVHLFRFYHQQQPLPWHWDWKEDWQVNHRTHPSHRSLVGEPQTLCHDKDSSVQRLYHQRTVLWEWDMDSLC